VTLCHGSTKLKNPGASWWTNGVCPHPGRHSHPLCAVGVEVNVARMAKSRSIPTMASFAVVSKYPAGDGSLTDWRESIAAFHRQGAWWS